MRLATVLTGLLLGAGLCVEVRAQDPGMDAQTKVKVEQALKDLGSADWETREKATQYLWSVGEPALSALEQASKSEDLEVSTRARLVVERLRAGLHVDTPAEIVSTVEAYRRATDGEVKRLLIEKLLDQGEAGLKMLPGIAQRETDPEWRTEIAGMLSERVRDLTRDMALRGDYQAAEGLLRLSASAGDPRAIVDYVTFVTVRGRLDPAIESATGEGKQGALALAHLCRANGDPVGAAVAANATGDQDLVEEMLLEAGDWKTLSDRVARPTGLTGLGRWAGLAQLAHKDQQLEEALPSIRETCGVQSAEIEDAVAQESADSRAPVGQCARMLVLLDRIDEAFKLLEEHALYAEQFETLTVGMRFREAMEVLKRAEEANYTGLWRLRLQAARMIGSLGEKDQARVLIEAAQTERTRTEGAGEDVILTRLAVGMREEAIAEIAAMLEEETTREEGLASALSGTVLLHVLYPDWEQSWQWVMAFADKRPAEGLKGALDRMEQLTHRKMSREDVESIAGEFAEAGNISWHDAAEACRKAGLTQTAHKWYEKDGEWSALMRLGVMALESKDWPAAAKWYHSAWEKERESAGAMYLEGHARVMAGERAEGERLMQAARVLPLGDIQVRVALSESLREAGLVRESAQEWDLLERTVETGVRSSAGEFVEHAREQKDWGQARRLLEWLRLECLSGEISTGRLGLDLALMAQVHGTRACGRLSEGDVTGAVREAGRGIEISPQDVEAVLELVPELTRRGNVKEADELFGKSYAAHEKALREYPRSALYHNNLAWLAARCGRRLPEALTHAQEAVSLDPDETAFIDTLAEVHYRLGHRDKAVELEKKCLQIDPDMEFAKEQLERFRRNDP